MTFHCYQFINQAAMSSEPKQLPALPEDVTAAWLGSKLGHKIKEVDLTRIIYGTETKLFKAMHELKRYQSNLRSNVTWRRTSERYPCSRSFSSVTSFLLFISIRLAFRLRQNARLFLGTVISLRKS